MPPAIFPYAIRLFGFDAGMSHVVAQAFADPRATGYGYFVLDEDNLQDPDIYIGKAADPDVLACLADLRPSEVRPALMIGAPAGELPFPHACIPEPVDPSALIAALDGLVEKRADALARLQASDLVLVPERRRRNRRELRNPAEYEKLRVRRPADGMVLVLDKSPALSDYLRDLMARHKLRVAWAGSEASALELCRRNPTAMVLINTSTPGVDPYRMCEAVKEKDAPVNPAVVFLVSKPFDYNIVRARHAGADGFLNKPLASHHLISVLKKFVPKLY